MGRERRQFIGDVIFNNKNQTKIYVCAASFVTLFSCARISPLAMVGFKHGNFVLSCVTTAGAVLSCTDVMSHQLSRVNLFEERRGGAERPSSRVYRRSVI